MAFSSLPSEIVHEIFSYLAPGLCNGSSSNLRSVSLDSRHCRVVCQPVLYKEIAVSLHMVPLLLWSICKTPLLRNTIKTLKVYPTEEPCKYENTLSDIGSVLVRSLSSLSADFSPEERWYTSKEAWLALLLAYSDNIEHFEWHIRSTKSYANDYMYFNNVVRAAASKKRTFSGLQRLSTINIHLDKEYYIEMGAILRLPCLNQLYYTNPLLHLAEKMNVPCLHHLEIQHDYWSVLAPDTFTPILRACASLRKVRLCLGSAGKAGGWYAGSYVIKHVIGPFLTSSQTNEILVLDLPVKVGPTSFGYLRPFEKLAVYDAPATMVGQSRLSSTQETNELPCSLKSLSLSMKTVTAGFKDTIFENHIEYVQAENLTPSLQQLILLWPWTPSETSEISKACSERGIEFISRAS